MVAYLYDDPRRAEQEEVEEYFAYYVAEAVWRGWRFRCSGEVGEGRLSARRA